jgi:hypothetical protein
MANPGVSSLSIQDVLVSGKGSKTAPIQCGGKEVILTLQAPVAFEPSAYGDAEKAATRVNLVLRASEQDMAWLNELDEFVIATLARDSAKYFGKPRTAEQIRESFTASIKDSERYSPTFKTKINLGGAGRVKIWDDEGRPRDAPETWKESLVKARVKVKGVWFMGQSSCGVTFDTTDVKVLAEHSEECPL